MNDIEKRLGFIVPKGTYPTILNDNTFSYYEQLCALAAVLQELNTELEGKQDALTFDPLPVANSTNPVYSGGVYSSINLLSQLLQATAGALAERITALETAMTFDAEPTQNSENLVKSGGIWSAIHDAVISLTQAIAAKQDILTWDPAPTNGSSNPVTSDGIYDALRTLQQNINTLLNGKQDTLTFDQTPTENSTNPVTSGGVYNSVKQLGTAIEGKQDILTFDAQPTANSTNPVYSGGVYSALENKQDKIIARTYGITHSGWTLSGGVYSTEVNYSGMTSASNIIVQNSETNIDFTYICGNGTLTLTTTNSAIANIDIENLTVFMFN